MMPHTQNQSRESLSRYLDGDLSAEEATLLAAQIARDTELQGELSALKAVRSAVRQQCAIPKEKAGETTRLRTFARFRATVEADFWQATPPPTPRVFLRGWRPILVPALAAIVVAGVYFLPSPVSNFGKGNNPNVQSSVELPGDRELSLLYDLHDAQGAPLSTDDTALQRHHTARAQADLLEYADNTVAESL
jgi:anti-sigma factor RsiW